MWWWGVLSTPFLPFFITTVNYRSRHLNTEVQYWLKLEKNYPTVWSFGPETFDMLCSCLILQPISLERWHNFTDTGPFSEHVSINSNVQFLNFWRNMRYEAQKLKIHEKLQYLSNKNLFPFPFLILLYL